MLIVKGTFDGTKLRLEKEVRVDHEVPVIVTFLEAPSSDADFREFLLAGPTMTQKELNELEGVIKEFRRWKT